MMKDKSSKQLVMRNGFHQERERTVVTTAGNIRVKVPRLSDRRGKGKGKGKGQEYSRLDSMIEGKMKPKLLKINTVLIRRPSLTGKLGRQQLIPFICFSGKCLEEYGFEVGKRFAIYAQKNQLVLKSKGFKYKNPIIKQKQEVQW